MIVSIRASSFGDLFDCPARWAFIHLESERSGREQVQSSRAWLGTSVHHATAVFDQARLDGNKISVDTAAEAFMDFFGKPETPVRWLDLPKNEAHGIGVTLTTRYCQQIAPLIEFEAVEKKLQPLEVSMGPVTLILTGTCDRIRVQYNARGISDVKTGARIISDGKLNAAKHMYQLATYEILEKMVERTEQKQITLPAQVIGLPTTGSLQPELGYVEGASQLMAGGSGDKGLLEMAANIIKSGNFYGNPRSSLCSETWCPRHPTCRFIGNGSKRKST